MDCAKRLWLTNNCISVYSVGSEWEIDILFTKQNWQIGMRAEAAVDCQSNGHNTIAYDAATDYIAIRLSVCATNISIHMEFKILHHISQYIDKRSINIYVLVSRLHSFGCVCLVCQIHDVKR